MIWNGGSVFQGTPISIQDMLFYKNYYEKIEMPLQLTITNPLINEHDCYDRYCNKILEIFENDLNEVLIVSPILEEYIRFKFPSYKINRSIVCSNINSKEDCVNLSKQYEGIVLPIKFNKDFNFLNTYPEELKSKTEILCNDPCPKDCPRVKEHYEAFGKIALFEKSSNYILRECTFLDRNNFHWRENDNLISFSDIENIYIPKGFSEFKISGRGSKFSILINLTPYLIKPQYYLQFIEYMYKFI